MHFDKINVKLAHKLKNVVYDGLIYTEDPTRVYEYASLASHVIGFVNYEKTGRRDQATFENQLKGKAGSRFVLKDGTGSVMSVLNENYRRSPTGSKYCINY